MGRDALVEIRLPEAHLDAFNMWLYWRFIESKIRVRTAQKEDGVLKIRLDIKQ